FRFIDKKGNAKEILLSVDVIPRTKKSVASLLDITERKKIEKELQENENRFREIFDNMNMAVAVYEARDGGKDFIFKDFNRSAEKIENIKKEDILGKSVLKMFPGMRSLGLFDVFQKVWKTGKSEHHPISFYRDGRISGWRENYVYKLPSGEIIAIYEDVTERKKMEEELKWQKDKLSSIISLTKDINILDIDVAIEKIADAIMHIVPYESLSFYVIDFENKLLVPKYAKGTYAKAVMAHTPSITEGITGRVVRSGIAEIVNDPFSDKDTQFIPDTPHEKEFMMAMPLVGRGGIFGVMDIFRKDKEFRSEDLEIATVFATQAAISLENAHVHSELRKTKEFRELFLSMLAHDLKNPLSISMNYAEMITEIPGVESMGMKIQLANERIRKIIDDAFLYAKLEAGTFKKEFKRMNLNEILRTSIRCFINHPKHKNIQTKLGEEIYKIDALSILTHVFMNLIDNALKYAGNCEVETEEKNNTYIVRVKDTGEGIPDKLKQNIFTKFERLGKNQNIKGTGLGLSIVRDIVELHNGKVWVEDNKPHGCVFVVELPKAK
ncbi:MAG: sensor histidine kinase, partial [Candidatus Methanofastidiosia archaeon]